MHYYVCICDADGHLYPEQQLFKSVTMLYKRSLFQSSAGRKLAIYDKESVIQDSRRAILILHGYAEYVDRYRSVIDRFSKEGYHVFAIDHFGHGRSEGQKGFVKDIRHLLGDASEWFESLQQQYPTYDWYIFGHSMGGGIALEVALRHQDVVKGLVLSGALIQLPDTVPGWMKIIGRLIAKITPSLPVVTIDLDLLSRDPEVVRIYKEDPMVYSGKVRARTAVELERLTIVLNEKLSQLKLPVWIGHGSLDRVTDPEGSKILHQRAVSPDKTLKIYHGLFHELLNEPENQVVMHDIIQWLTKR
jgi:alpha-beta hydrolase superfamily lysophospholipase